MDTAVTTQLVADKQPPKITEGDVRMAYRLILGREAESDAVVKAMVASGYTLPELRQRFLQSDEFRGKASSFPLTPSAKPLAWPPMSVEVDVSNDVLEKMLKHIEANWQILGETEPHWSVLTQDVYKASNVSGNVESFYGTGNRSLLKFKTAAERCGAALPSDGVCFELGCGVGRVTLALSKAFAKVIGGDISQAHLRIAQETITNLGHDNVEYVHLGTIGALSRLPNFDGFFSLIVLQHNPPPVMKLLLSIILRKLNRGGLAYFQVPTYQLNYSFNSEAYMSKLATNGAMEVHILPQTEVFRIIREADCEVLEVREDDSTRSPHVISNAFLTRKR